MIMTMMWPAYCASRKSLYFAVKCGVQKYNAPLTVFSNTHMIMGVVYVIFFR